MKAENQTDQKKSSKAENPLISAYDRIVERISKSSLETADSSVLQLRKMVDDAIELEQAAEQMSSDELHLLAEYVHRDLKLLAHYLHDTGEGLAAWLNFDLAFLEQSTKQQFMHLADPTILENIELQEKLECSSVQYLAGEVCAAGTLRCLNCTTEQQVLHTQIISACGQCQSIYFERISK
ncbi:MAG: hypothetical protein OFPII_40950 [Osedax symbiont Rs1]|nr:MAG: hypothetical protein OFPII_40950 [Osedax symbiont Rs1]